MPSPYVKKKCERASERERKPSEIRSVWKPKPTRARFNKGSESKSHVPKVKKLAINKGTQAQILHANCNRHMEHIIQKEASVMGLEKYKRHLAPFLEREVSSRRCKSKTQTQQPSQSKKI